MLSARRNRPSRGAALARRCVRALPAICALLLCVLTLLSLLALPSMARLSSTVLRRGDGERAPPPPRARRGDATSEAPPQPHPASPAADVVAPPAPLLASPAADVAAPAAPPPVALPAADVVAPPAPLLASPAADVAAPAAALPVAVPADGEAPLPTSPIPDVAPAGPVDAVFTYVTDEDASWRRELAAALRAAPPEVLDAATDDAADGEAVEPGQLPPLRLRFANKFREWGELRYALRSYAAHAPWLRTLYVVTAGPSQTPRWLNTSHPRIRLVHHAALFDAPAAQLPTFNSLAIESVLHRIPGLSELFVYVNNDLLLGAPLALTDLITTRAYMEYVDWPLSLPHLCPADALVPGTRSLRDAAYAPPRYSCRGEPFAWDALLARSAFGAAVEHWPAHTPHLWSRAGMRAIESALAPQLAVSRASRLRDPASDVSVHVQYEAWRRAAAAAAGAPLQVQRRHMSAEAYLYKTFEAGAGDAFYADIRQRIADERPRFIGIDDDIAPPAPSAARRAYHRHQLALIMHSVAPEPAPWELDGGADPALASPPPTPPQA